MRRKAVALVILATFIISLPLRTYAAEGNSKEELQYNEQQVPLDEMDDNIQEESIEDTSEDIVDSQEAIAVPNEEEFQNESQETISESGGNNQEIQQGFVVETDGVRYYGDDGQFLTGEKSINGVVYCFNDEGYLMLGLQKDSRGSVHFYIDIEPYVVKGQFYTLDDGVRYFDNQGEMLISYNKIEGYWYYFDENGIMFSDRWLVDGDRKYYYDANGHLVRGFYKIDSQIYYFDNTGNMVVGAEKIEGYWYYFDENGVMFNAGWRVDGDKTYYYDNTGHLIRGFYSIDGQTYYFNNTGNMTVGIEKIGSDWYYFDEKGVMFNAGWRVDGDKVYYYFTDGKLALKEKKIDGYWYYFQNNGNMYTGWRISGNRTYYYESDGHLSLGIKKIGDYWYYFQNNGDMYKGWRTSANKTYYYDSNGHLALGTKKIGSYWYYFQNDGTAYKGWRTVAGSKYYYDGSGRLAQGAKKIGSNWYYFQSNGVMYKGWRTSGSNKYYYNSSGVLQIGPSQISGKWYYFNTDGALSADQSMAKKAQTYSSKTSWLIMVDTKKNKVAIYSGAKGDWAQSKYWSCTSGAKATPTVKGQFTVGIKGKVFGSGYSCWYYTQFYGDYLFHSILYNPGSMTSVQDGRLGINASHGCIRLSLGNAKWIYDNIPKNTKVVVY